MDLYFGAAEGLGNHPTAMKQPEFNKGNSGTLAALL